MKQLTKIWLFIAVVLILSGALVFAAAMTANGWDFTKLSTVTHTTNTHTIREDFQNISIQTDTADVILLLSDDGQCKVVCLEAENETHAVSLQGETLTIRKVDSRKWYEAISIGIKNEQLLVYLPKSEYGTLTVRGSTCDTETSDAFEFETIEIDVDTGDVKNFSSASAVTIKTSTGDINIGDVSADTLSLSSSTGDIRMTSTVCTGDIMIRVSTGKVKLTEVSCANLSSFGSTGDLTLKNVIASGILSAERSTGDVSLENSDAAEIRIQTSTGDVTGTLLSDKIFITKTDTGTVSVPASKSGGNCDISTNTGDIRITICG